METIKVMSTTYPKSQLPMNEWMVKYKVSSRLKDVYKPTARVEYLQSQYDRTKLSTLLNKKQSPSAIITYLINKLFD
jgi:hypothetical protein